MVVPGTEIKNKSSRRDRRLDEPCPKCGYPVGQLVFIGGALLLAVGGMGEDGIPSGLLIKKLDQSVCLVCGYEYSYHVPLPENIIKLLLRRGFSQGEIRDIIKKPI